MKDVLKTVVVLALIAIISGALLGLVNDITYIDADQEMARQLGKVYDNPSDLKAVEYSNNSGLSGIGEVQNAFVSSDGTYVLKVLGMGGYGGTIELLYAIKDNKIIKIVPFSHSETPGLGTKGFEASYLRQYYNLNLEDVESLILVKNIEPQDSEILTITSATFTANAIINASNVAINWYRTNAE